MSFKGVTPTAGQNPYSQGLRLYTPAYMLPHFQPKFATKKYS